MIFVPRRASRRHADCRFVFILIRDHRSSLSKYSQYSFFKMPYHAYCVIAFDTRFLLMSPHIMNFSRMRDARFDADAAGDADAFAISLPCAMST